jgi:hypothetical protein
MALANAAMHLRTAVSDYRQKKRGQLNVRKVTSEEFHKRFMAVHALTPQLEAYWLEVLPSIPVPNSDQFERWLHIHGYTTEPLKHAIRSAARRLTRKPFNDSQHHLQYISAVALSYLNEEREGRAA